MRRSRPDLDLTTDRRGRPLQPRRHEEPGQLCSLACDTAETINFVSTLFHPPHVVSTMAEAIRAEILRTSRHVTCANFTRVSNDDLARLFELYDAHFFGDRLRRLVDQEANGRLSLRFSGRMARAGGRTTCTRAGTCPDCGRFKTAFCEIAISSTLLFQTFRGETRPVTVNGVCCRDRFDALQRIFEHELIHLVEMLAWGGSDCTAARFQDLSRRIFSHAGVTHGLVTATERTVTDFDVRPGDRVCFVHEGVRRAGVVNRVNRRVTVLVESDDGAPYDDGRRYRKYYVPPHLLEIERRMAGALRLP